MILLPDDAWQIKTTPKKGRGIFVTKDLPAGTVIGDYIGKVIKTAEEDTHEKDDELYLMYYHDYASLYPVDVKAPGLHLINHSCAPNCWMYTYKGHTLFFALRHIFAGEELTVSYLLSPDRACHPCHHICHCESIICYHTMHLSQERFDKWDAFETEQAKQTKRARIRYGKVLPTLPEYPKSIPDHPIYTLVGSATQPALILEDKKLPPTQEIRKIIRETGRILEFPALKTKVFGVDNDTILQKATKIV
jgi:uncharacterized protein